MQDMLSSAINKREGYRFTLKKMRRLAARLARGALPFVAVLIVWATAQYMVITSPYLMRLAQKLKDSGIVELGQLGDTFGSFSALMAAFAAVGAVLALREQRASAKTSSFLNVFAGLMDRICQTVQDTKYYVVLENVSNGVVTTELVDTRSGQSAFDELAQELRQSVLANSKPSYTDEEFFGLMDMVYRRFYLDYKGDLGHYFRQVYHTLNYLSVSNEPDSNRLIKILRASCTNSQLLLLSYNCSFGDGAIKFADLVTRHSFLHNLAFELDALGKLERRMIISRMGESSLKSKSGETDQERETFLARATMNRNDRQRLQERLLLDHDELDFGVSWLDS